MEMACDIGSTRTLPKQSDVGGVAAEIADEVIQPFESLALVTQTIIPNTFVCCKLIVFTNSRTGSKAEDAKTIVDRYHDDGLP
jgi:hypothetical protein